MKKYLCKQFSAAASLPFCVTLLTGAALVAAILLPSRVQEEARLTPSDFTAATTFDVVAAGDRVHLLFGQPMSDPSPTLTLFYSRSDDAGQSWSSPVRLPSGHAPPGRHLRSNDPQLAVFGDRVMALWTAEGNGPWGSGPLGSALSDDGGLTWRAGPAPDGRPDAGYRFPATAGDEGGFHAIWIHAEDNERALHHARLDFDDQHWSDPTVIDGHICACCWNTLRVDRDGNLLALYRDQDPSDMGLAVSANRGADWQVPEYVGDFDWQFAGCPHVGGGLATGFESGGNPVLLASVWTGHAEKGGTYILRSEDGGNHWEQTRVPGNRFQGNSNTDIALLGNDRAIVTWDASMGDLRAVFIAASPDAGKTWGEAIQISDTHEFATHPRLVATENRILLFWSLQNSGGKWRLETKEIAKFN